MTEMLINTLPQNCLHCSTYRGLFETLCHIIAVHFGRWFARLSTSEAFITMMINKIAWTRKKCSAKGPVPLERIAVAFTSDYEIIAFLGIRD